MGNSTQQIPKRMNVLQRLEQLGQSIWYDNISRSLIRSGELQRMVKEGLLGVTSNPTIFDKAISGSTDYDDQIRGLVQRNRDLPVADIIRELMVEDIRMAADVLLPAYEGTGGRDGYVSVEVTPSKARDTQATIEEVRLLWSRIGRKNLMVKIPATEEGLPAIEEAIAEGMNINVTLIFAVDRYRQVANAYLNGLDRRMNGGKPLDHIASVASVFVSRIDSLVDDLLQKKISAGSPGDAGRLGSLMGVAAIANTKLVYQAFREIFESPRFQSLKGHGAGVQRPLWGSTSTKNPAYQDLIYVDTLIGPNTVNTVPPATYTAILDHGKAVLTVETALDEARAGLRELAAAGIDMGRVTRKLEEDGVASFEKSFDGLYKNLEVKKSEFSRRDAG
jgi:transaldolase/glucose-6-phosphate isomerase